MPLSLMRRLSLAGLLAMLVASLSALLDKASGEDCPSACFQGRFRIAVSGGFTGPFASFTTQVFQASNQAARMLNERGGVRSADGRSFPIEIQARDDQCNPQLAATIARELVERDRIGFVVGPLCGPAAAAASPVLGRGDLIQILPSVSTSPLVHPHQFRLIPEVGRELQLTRQFLSGADYRNRPLLVVHDDTAVGAETLRTLATLTAFKGAIPMASDADPATVAAAIRTQNPQVIYLALPAIRLAPLMSRLQDLPQRPTIISRQINLHAAALADAGVAAAMLRAIGSIQPQSATLEQAVTQLRRAEIIADAPALLGFSAIETIVNAVNLTGRGDAKLVAAVMKSRAITSAIASIEFDQTGELRSVQPSLLRLQNGRIAPD